MQQRAGLRTRAAQGEHWRKVIAAAEASGETIRGYCERHGIQPSHYYYWRRRLQQDEPARSTKEGGAFLLVGTAGLAPALELVVERGWRLRIGAGVEESALRKVLSALAAES